MTYRISYGSLPDKGWRSIYVVKIEGELLDDGQVAYLSEDMRGYLLSRGEPTAEIVVLQGLSRETLKLSGENYAVRQVREALFHAQISWTPISL